MTIQKDMISDSYENGFEEGKQEEQARILKLIDECGNYILCSTLMSKDFVKGFEEGKKQLYLELKQKIKGK